MKQTLIFLFLILLAVLIDIKPIVLENVQSDTIHVTVIGNVESPGQIELPLYSSIQDALDVVGLTEDADISSLNPQTVLKDHDLIDIPSKQDAQVIKISINTGTKEELMLIPGVGESTAENIISYRNQNGLFQTIEDIMEVKGIGQAKFDKMKDMIRL